MQHTQHNVAKLCARALLVAAVILAANPASAGRITHAGKPDPLLDGGETSACMAGSDLAAGTDATGGAVIPADVGAPRVMLPDEIMVPVGGAGQPQLGGAWPQSRHRHGRRHLCRVRRPPDGAVAQSQALPALTSYGICPNSGAARC